MDENRIVEIPQRFALPCGYYRLFWRPEFQDCFERLQISDARCAVLEPRKRVTVFLGDRGSGKTSFLTLLLIFRLLQRKPTILQLHSKIRQTFYDVRPADEMLQEDAGTEYILFDEDGVTSSSSCGSVFESDRFGFPGDAVRADPDVWVLADDFQGSELTSKQLPHFWRLVVTCKHEMYMSHAKDQNPIRKEFGLY